MSVNVDLQGFIAIAVGPGAHERDDQEEVRVYSMALHAMATVDWILVHVVSNGRTVTVRAFERDLAAAGIDLPLAVVDSPTWFGAFLRKPSVAKHEDGFMGLFRD